jgi:hypothetical protein
MNAHYEIAESNYPISPMRFGEGYKITDMRSLKPLHSQPISHHDATQLSAHANAGIRNGKFSKVTDAADVAEYVQSIVDAA